MREDGANEDRPQRSFDLDVLEVPALPTKEPWVFGAKGRDAEGRGRDGGHGEYGPIAGGKGTMRTIRLLTAATCLVLLPSTVAAAVASGDGVAAPAGAAAIKVVPVKTGLNIPAAF